MGNVENFSDGEYSGEVIVDKFSEAEGGRGKPKLKRAYVEDSKVKSPYFNRKKSSKSRSMGNEKVKKKIYSLSFKFAVQYKQRKNEIQYKKSSGKNLLNTEVAVEDMGIDFGCPPSNLLKSIVPIKERVRFFHLSRSLLKIIAEYIRDFQTFKACSLTCKSFRRFLIDTDSVDLNVIFPLSSHPRSVLRHVRKLRVENHENSPNFKEIFKRLPNISSIRTTFNIYRNNVEKFNSSLRLDGLHLIHNGNEEIIRLQTLLKANRKLSKLEIRSTSKRSNLFRGRLKNDFYSYELRVLRLNNITVAPEVLSSILRRCLNISTLRCSNCDIDDDCILALSETEYPDITRLALPRNSITFLGFSQIIKKFPECEYLDLYKNDIYLVSSDFSIVKLHERIKTLRLNRNPGIEIGDWEEMVEFLNIFRRIKYLEVVKCDGVEKGIAKEKKLLKYLSSRNMFLKM